MRPRLSSLRPLAVLLPLLALPAAVVAQDAAVAAADAPPTAAATKPCSAPEYRHFDFWLGTWDVRGTQGGPPSRNVIRAVHGGCAIREEYHTEQGYEGSSLNFYDSRDGRWHQTWIDNQGGGLFLTGGLENGSMVMSSTGDPIDRVTWTPRDDGTVRQHWQRSSDGGETWATVFDGTYTRLDEDAASE